MTEHNAVTVESPADEMARVEFRIADLDNPVDWPDFFGNSNPVEIEVGSGKGRFIIESADLYPEINYVGIERALPYFRIMKTRVQNQGFTNVRALCDDGLYFISKFVRENSVTAYHVYFPDPWPKNRHRKRRLVNPEFLAHVARTLIPGGTFDLATDHAEYFAAMLRLLNASAALHPVDDLPERVRRLGSGFTNFEAKYLAEGRSIYRATYRKKEQEKDPC
jgi:tRNA (guanine-N7-)-methyltransferase